MWRDRARKRASELVLAGVLVAAAAGAVATYPALNHTYDEGVHLQAGLEWIERGTFTLEPKQPPLARVAVALGPWLDGTRMSTIPYRRDVSLYEAGNDVLYRGDYARTLALARLGTLPFLLATIALAWGWGRRAAGRGAAAVAAVLCAAMPPLLGHGALATLDVAAAATLGAALLAWDRLLERRTRGRALTFGATLALTLLAKISAFVTVPVALLLIWGTRHLIAPRKQVSSAGASSTGTSSAGASSTGISSAGTSSAGTSSAGTSSAGTSSARTSSAGASSAGASSAGASSAGTSSAGTSSAGTSSAGTSSAGIGRWRAVGWTVLAGVAVLWIGYRLSFGAARPEDAVHRGELATELEVCAGRGALRSMVDAVLDVPVPAPELVRGLIAACAHNARGHTNVYLGQLRMRGSTSFFPVVLATKTPLGFLALVAVGIAGAIAAARRRERAAVWIPVAAATAVLFAVLPSHVHIGLRHILAVYPLLAAAAGAGAVALWRAGRWRRAAVVVLVGSAIATTVEVHPDHIAYYNALAGDRPERIAIATDLDWGQDLARLGDVLRARGATRVSLAYFGSADPCAHGLPRVFDLPPGTRVTGWVAVSEMRRFGGLSVHLASPRCRAPPPDPRAAGHGYAWLDRYPVAARAGRSIRVYFIPPI